MRIPTIDGLVHMVKASLRKSSDRYIRRISGVIHVGANHGNERNLYRKYRLPVVWVEPIPEVFDLLESNIKSYRYQQALKCLVTDQDNVEYEFHISSNDGASSSILDFKLHKDIWPEVVYEKTIKLQSLTLTTLLKQEGIDAGDYDALVMDTQGSELLVLKGAAPLLHNFKYIETEVADFESYEGCCQLKDIDSFLKEHGFKEYSRHKFAEHSNGGSYYDIVYERL